MAYIALWHHLVSVRVRAFASRRQFRGHYAILSTILHTLAKITTPMLHYNHYDTVTLSFSIYHQRISTRTVSFRARCMNKNRLSHKWSSPLRVAVVGPARISGRIILLHIHQRPRYESVVVFYAAGSKT